MKISFELYNHIVEVEAVFSIDGELINRRIIKSSINGMDTTKEFIDFVESTQEKICVFNNKILNTHFSQKKLSKITRVIQTEWELFFCIVQDLHIYGRYNPENIEEYVLVSVDDVSDPAYLSFIDLWIKSDKWRLYSVLNNISRQHNKDKYIKELNSTIDPFTTDQK